MFKGKAYPIAPIIRAHWIDNPAYFDEMIAAMKANNVTAVMWEMPYSYVCNDWPVNGEPVWTDSSAPMGDKVGLFDIYFRRLYEEGFVVYVAFLFDEWWNYPVGGTYRQGSPLNEVSHDAATMLSGRPLEYLDVLFRSAARRWNYPNMIWGSWHELDAYTMFTPDYTFANTYPHLCRWAHMQKAENPDCLTILSLSGTITNWDIPRQWWQEFMVEFRARGLPDFDAVSKGAYTFLAGAGPPLPPGWGAFEPPCTADILEIRNAGKMILVNGTGVEYWGPGFPNDTSISTYYKDMTYAERNAPLISLTIEPALACGFKGIFINAWRHPSQEVDVGSFMDMPANIELVDYVSAKNLEVGKILSTPKLLIPTALEAIFIGIGTILIGI